MFARLLALCCLATAVSTARPEPASDAGLAVYLDPSAALPSPTVEPMKRELAQLMQTAGYAVDWFDAATPLPTSGVPFLAVLKLDGSCSMPSGSDANPAEIRDLDPLATTAVSNGHVLPFITVDCRKLTHLLSPSLASEPAARRDYLYGRALARIVAHELYHALLDTACHSRDGVTKAAVAARELLGAHFAFEEEALAKLEHRAADSTPAFDAVSGRQ